ncbi:sugar phosphate isomerase/epimerase family protein [Brevibacterium oceani]|uniref:sugar phosphate isomerase/epimerase family protein n=1 Tax=Brevibacterium oceani TaxID=358099 RepID=UPI0015E77A42|nr:TIM barrel protein [Brevibacterium oceani]
MTDIGIAHLSLLHLDPDALVDVAARAGFDFVGIRVRGATAGEDLPDQSPGSRMSRETLVRLDDTGLQVRDIEFLSLDGTTGREEWMPMLEAGAALGASTLNLAGQDPDFPRLTETLGALVVDAAAYGITPALELISYNAVSTVAQARDIATAAGAHVMLDPLHLQRGANTPAEVADLDASLIPVVQLCDGPLELPDRIDITGELPRGMTAEGEVRKVESRAHRLVPGDGEFPLRELLAAVPEGVPLSLEVPNAGLVTRLGDLAYARVLRESAEALLTGVDHD